MAFAGPLAHLLPVWHDVCMGLGKTITLRFEGATWGELREFVRLAGEMGIADSADLEVEYAGDGEREEIRIVGLEAFAHLD